MTPIATPRAAPRAAFQALLSAFGLPELRAEKSRLGAALRSGLAPTAFTPASHRHGRATARITLRQLGWTEPRLPALPAWRAALEPAAD